MKYFELLQIASYFDGFSTLNRLRRIANNELELILDDQRFIINLEKGKSGIYKSNKLIQNYNSPFDMALKKRIKKSKLIKAKILPNNRVLLLIICSQGSYKSTTYKLYFEFTGKHTNLIFTDENDVIIEALRHISKSHRSVKIGQKLAMLEPFLIKEKQELKINNWDEYFASQEQKINEANIINTKKTKLAYVAKKILLTNKKLQALQSVDELSKKASLLRKKADLLALYIHSIPDFKREFILKDLDDKEIAFHLDLPPKQALNELYKQARRTLKKSISIKIEQNSLKEILNQLEEIQIVINNTNDLTLLKAFFTKKQKHKTQDEFKGIQNFYFEDFKLSVGLNERANEVLLKEAKKDDLWLHLSKIKGSHVIIKARKSKFSPELIAFGAKLCVQFSKVLAGNYLIDYTTRKNVKVIEKAFVNYVSYKTISVIKE